MNVFLWIVAALLALVFLGAGATKLTQPKPKLAEAGIGWVDDLFPGALKVIGALEVLAAIGLVLPALLDIAPVLVPLAALGLVLMMGGAAVSHLRRSEVPMVAFNLTLLALAAVVAWGRFGPYALPA